MAACGFRSVRIVRPRNMRPFQIRDARFRDEDCDRLAVLQQGRPLAPPGPLQLEERRVSAAQIEAMKAERGLARITARAAEADDNDTEPALSIVGS
jgi:hypothetical protein